MAKRTGSTQPAQSAAPAVIEFETEVGGSTLPTMLPSPKWVYTTHPERWIILDGRLVPSLSRFALVPGVNTVTDGANGTIGIADARSKLEKENRRIVPQEWGPLDAGNGRKTYVQAVQTQSGAPTYISAWESWSPGSPTTWSDLPEYAAWLESLVTSGKLPPCPEKVLHEMLSTAVARLARAETIAAGLTKGNALAARERVEVLTKEVEVLRAHLAKSTSASPKKKGSAVEIDLAG